MMTLWQYGHGSYPFSVCDGACMSRLRSALDGLKAAEAGEGEEQSAAYRRMIEGFFDTLFGPGVGREICVGDEDAPSEAYLSFTEHLSDQLNRIKAAREEAEERYLSRLPHREETGDGFSG